MPQVILYKIIDIMQTKDQPKASKPGAFKPADILKVSRFSGGAKFTNQSRMKFNNSQFHTQHKGGS